MHTIKAESAGFSAERLGRIRPALQRCIDEGRIAGMATLIARHGRVIHCEAYGLMDLEAERPMTTDGIVRIYSMSKPITSVAAMMLHEEGRFLLSEPVSAFLPEFADVEVYAGEGPDGPRTVPLERPITMHHLFTHTAGLAYGLDRSTPVDAMYQDVNARRRRPPTLATWIHDLAEIRRWLEVFIRRFFANQFKRSALPNGPKVSNGGTMSPRGDWRMPADASPAAWLADLAHVP